MNFTEYKRIANALKMQPSNKYSTWDNIMQLCLNMYEDNHDYLKYCLKLSKAVKLSAQRLLLQNRDVRFEDLYWQAVKFEAPHLFDSYLLYLERKRLEQDRFYSPKRKQLNKHGLIQSLQDMEDDKLDILSISMPPGTQKTTLEKFFCSWIIGRHPDDFSLFFSHSGDITRMFYTEFVTGQEYETAEGSQPEISEAESLTAPDASVVKREQKTNVTQIFQESVGISYGKMSNMGTLSGINVAGQQANPISEEDFQVAAKMAKIGQDIEYTFINGVYQKSTGDNVPNKSRGLLTAIASNIVDADGKMLSFMLLCEAIKCIDDSNGDTTNLVVGLDSTGRLQLNADAAANGLTIVSAGRDINGIAVDQVLTPLGTVYLKTLKYLPTGTVKHIRSQVEEQINTEKIEEKDSEGE